MGAPLREQSDSRRLKPSAYTTYTTPVLSPPWDAVYATVEGAGAERVGSVYTGLTALDACALAVIHDGARPSATRAPHGPSYFYIG